MAIQIVHFIDGQRTAGQSERTADVLNPSTGEVQAQVPMASTADVDAAVAIAVEAQKEWAAWNPQRRARVMMKFVELVNQNIDELAELLSLEHGKTVADSRATSSAASRSSSSPIGIPHLLKGEYTEGAGTGIDVYSLRQPLGVVAGITPFNFPAMIPLWKAGPALACGNAFILKPSERDPSVPVRLAELFLEAGLPKGVFQVVHGDKEAVDAILDHPDIQAVGFVGSSDIAQYIYSTAAANGKRAQCFGGAKNHMIVMPDADLDQAVDALIGAGYGSAGERCMAISVAVPVGEQTADRLRARLSSGSTSCASATASTPRPTTARWSPRPRWPGSRTTSARASTPAPRPSSTAANAPATTCTFGDASLEGGYFIGPTLFDHVTPDMSIYTDEIFGPVLCIVRANDYEEALRAAVRARIRQRRGDFHSRRRHRPRLRVPGAGRHGRRERADPGTGGLPHLRRLEAVRLRRPQPARPGVDHLLHQGQDGDAALALGHQWRRVRHPHDEVELSTHGFFGLDEDERVIAETAAAFAEKRIAPYALEWDATKHFPVDVLREAAELGMAAIYCREDVGGSGLRRLDAVRIFEQLATADPTIAAFLSIHNMCAWMVDTYGTHEQRKSWVPRLASMEAIASYCLTEPGAGSDAGALRTKAVRDGDDYVIDGVKQFISGAGSSDVYVVMARTGGDGPRGISAFIVEKGTPGLSFGADEAQDGLERPAHRAGDLRGRPGAGRRDARRRRRRGHRLRHRDERAQRRPHQHRRVLAGRRAGRPRQGGELPR